MNTINLSDPLVIAIIILIVTTITLAIMVINTNRKLKNFLIGIDSKNISDSLNMVSGDLEDLKSFKKELETYLEEVERRLRKSVQSVHTVRFNPFKGTGGGSNQSFATTLITEEGDGVIISSLYSREHVSVFAKPLKAHGTEYELSEEEVQSLENAKKGLK